MIVKQFLGNNLTFNWKCKKKINCSWIHEAEKNLSHFLNHNPHMCLFYTNHPPSLFLLPSHMKFSSIIPPIIISRFVTSLSFLNPYIHLEKNVFKYSCHVLQICEHSLSIIRLVKKELLPTKQSTNKLKKKKFNSFEFFISAARIAIKKYWKIVPLRITWRRMEEQFVNRWIILILSSELYGWTYIICTVNFLFVWKVSSFNFMCVTDFFYFIFASS